MTSEQPELEELTRIVRELLFRVTQLERRLDALSRGSSGQRDQLQSNPAAIERTPSPALRDSHAGRVATDLESRIGAQWLNRVGIVAVLIGVSFFLKYTLGAGWIGPIGRVWIGLIGGAALIGWSEWFRVHQYRIFSFSLKALGLAILYLSLWASFQVYELLVWTGAFGCMVAVTALASVLALWQDAEPLALIALVGGFVTPVLLYTRENHAIELFSYTAVLNAAALFLAASRGWRRLLLLSVIATFLLFCLWYAGLYEPVERGTTLLFLTMFFGIFTAAPLIALNRMDTANARAILPAVAGLNAGFFFVELYLLLGRTDSTSAAWCAVALAGVYLGLAEMLRRQRSAPKLKSLHFALSSAFLTLAIAIYFESYWISIAWFAEAAVVMAIGFWRRSAFVRWQALALIAITIGKVFILDVWSLERGYRIMSFVLLGMLLLGVSFLYQRDWLKPMPADKSENEEKI